MDTNNQQNIDDIISIKDIINLVQDYLLEALLSWKLILISAILFTIYFGIRNKYDEDEYSASLTFVLSDEGGGLGQLSGLLGSFGLGGGGNRGGVNLDKMVELSRSDRIIKEALVNKFEIDKNTDFLGNHFIKIYELDKIWNEKDESVLKDFSFKKDSILQFELADQYASKVIRSRLIGSKSRDPIMTCSFDELSGILTLNATTRNPQLSIAVVESVYDVVDSFYVTTAVERQQWNFDVIKAKVDSLNSDIESKEYALANFRDSNKATFKEVDKLKESRLANKLKISYLALGEAVKSLELASYSLDSQKPILSVVDRPFLPILNSRQPLPFALILGFVFGVLLSLFYVFGRKAFRDVMNKN